MESRTRAHLAGEEAAAAHEAQIAQRREPHLHAELRVEEGVHLLQLRGDLPLRDPVVVERPVVEHAQVDVQVHHSRASACSVRRR